MKALHYDIESNPSVLDYFKKNDVQMINTGLSAEQMLNETPDNIRKIILNMRQGMTHINFLLGAGCCLYLDTPVENIHAAITAAREITI
ncbi:MAG: uroporphyrinogen decarboxylase family protein [Methylococcaceae bacterium]|nr:uroporphyrinogen decarboxylase family protein [Methylococcaceae bacterium]